jgi:hypothetical protein
MTTDSLHTDQFPKADVVSSAFDSTSEVWNEVLERLSRVQEGHRRLSETVDQLGAVFAHVVEEVAEPAPAAATAPATRSASVTAFAPSTAFAPPTTPTTPPAWPEAPAPRIEEPTVAVIDTLAEPEVETLPEPEVEDTTEAKTDEPATASAEATLVESPEEHEWLEEPPVESLIESEAERAWLSQEVVEMIEIGAEAPAIPEATVTHEEVRESEEPAFAASVETNVVAETGAPPETPEAREDTSERGHEGEPGAGYAPGSDELSGQPQVLPALRVLDPELTPELIDALLAAEFGEAAARFADPEVLTLDTLLSEEFGQRPPAAEPTVDSAAEASLSTAVTEPETSESPKPATSSLTSWPYVHVSPVPEEAPKRDVDVVAEPADAKDLLDYPDVADFVGPDLPPAAQDGVVIVEPSSAPESTDATGTPEVAESVSALPVEPPPIPEPVDVPEPEQDDDGTVAEVEVAASTLAEPEPEALVEDVVEPDPSLELEAHAEEPEVAEVASAVPGELPPFPLGPPVVTGGVSVEEPVDTVAEALHLHDEGETDLPRPVTELPDFSVAADARDARASVAAEFPGEAVASSPQAATDDEASPPTVNLVSEDVTIISSKRKRFRLH